MNNDQSSIHPVTDIVEDRMRRAFAGEDVGPTSGLTYGQYFPAPTEDETRMAIDRTNYERGRDAEREACAQLADMFDTGKYYTEDARARAIAAAIRARSQESPR
jgi:hypothetical protein